MKTKKTYAVFGLGRYGRAVARELVENGMEVIAVDAEQKIVNDAAAYLPVCKCADVTDSEVISRLGISNIDTVIVCMANNLEASVDLVGAHCANQCDSICSQMVINELIKTIPVFIKHKHMNNSDSKKKIKLSV